MRVAIVHEWLVNIAGSEKVVAELLKIWPDADLFAVVDFLDSAERDVLQGKVARTTFIQRMPGARRRYKGYLPLMPFAVEQLDVTSYDLVISSSHAVAKGVMCGPDQLHICYVHSPIRYAWDFQHQYLRESGLERGLKSWLARLVLHYIRIWDTRSANGVDYFIANSQFIKRRIAKAYRRDATVIHPPVATEDFVIGSSRGDFYLTASRMVPYKKIPLIIEAFALMPDKKLIVIGDGPEFEKAKAQSTANVELLGYQSFDVLREHMQRAKAFVFAAEEDFGITPVEAQACGTPVIAYGRGGALETVNGLNEAEPTGLFYYEQTPAAIINAVQEFERSEGRITSKSCRTNSERFSRESFRQRIAAFVEKRFIERASRHEG